MVSFRAGLLTTASLLSLMPGVVLAQTAKPIETITVVTQGQTRSVQSIDQDVLQDAAPGTTPIKALGMLPGVNVQGADSFGAYEWAERISVRGFSQNQLGFTLDDVPLGDMSYGNWNGLHISRAIINENIAKTELSQGTGAIGTASNTNLGGTMRFESLTPAEKFTATGAQSIGSDAAYRTFARVDSGRLATGTKFSLSAVNQTSDKWKGDGEQHAWQINAKAVQDIKLGSLTGFVNYSDRREVDYQDMSKEMVSKLGYRWDNYYPDWKSAVNAANGVYTHGEANTSDPLDDAYYAGSGLRKDLLTGLTSDLKLSQALSWKTTLYGHIDNGRGLWFTPYTSSPTGSPVALRTSEYTQYRGGLVSNASYVLDRQTIEGGVWYEKEKFDLARRFYATSVSDPMHSVYDFPSNPFYTQWNYHFDIDVVQGHVQDTYRLTDTISLNAGTKAVSTKIYGKLAQGSGYPTGDVEASSPFLPQAGVNWQVAKGHEVFADVAKNMRTFTAGGAGFGASPFATTQAGFDAIKGNLKPETAWSEEIGYRLKQDGFAVSAVGYHVNFSHRLLATQQGAGIAGNPSVLSNVGGVTSNGLELATNVRLIKGLSWYNALGYDKSTYDEDVISNGNRIHTSGKSVVDTPEWMYKTKLGYDYKGFFANLSGDYMSKRFYSYTNDASVNGRWLFDLGAGYVAEDLGAIKDARIQLNVTNLFDKKYYSSLGTNGFVNSDPSGQAQTLMVGAPRAFFLTVSVSY